MSATAETQYLLRWKGIQSGPFSLATIREKLEAGEISRMHQVNLNGTWTVLDELLERQSRDANAKQRAETKQRETSLRRSSEEHFAAERTEQKAPEEGLTEAERRSQLLRLLPQASVPSSDGDSGSPIIQPQKRITILRDGNNVGPYTIEQINRMLATAKLSPSDLGWVEGTSDWVPVESIPGVASTLAPESQLLADRGGVRVARPWTTRILRLAAALLCLAGLGCIGVYSFRPSGTGALRWDPPIVRKSLMTFAYKVYGNPAVKNGRYYLSKIVFHNDGHNTVHNFSISYQIPDYIPWTTEETHTEIPSGQTVVKLFYPQLPAKVTLLTAQTTVTLETRIRWSNEVGQPREEILRSNVELRGVNEVEYTELPQNEIVTWNDMFTGCPFLAAMVTPNDPVVKEFAATITERIGGTTAGARGGLKETAQIMAALYDYMCQTNMRYTSALGVPEKLGDVRTLVQTVRMPRDVIISNEGLCVELALLWSSVMEHFGLRTKIVIVPGHAFAVVYLGDGSGYFIPVECTAITPKAVNKEKPVSFTDAVDLARAELASADEHFYLDVRGYQAGGFRAPELPAVEIDKIKDILAKRTSGIKGTK